MANTVITVARSYGSGGRMIGQQLADSMKIAYYDRNLIYLASDKSGLDARVLSEYDESVRKTPFHRSKYFSSGIVPPETRRFTSHSDIFHCQQNIIREVAAKSDCVIIGRCAEHALKNSGHHLLRVFIWAPHEFCIENVMKKFSISREEADKIIRDINKHRQEYYKYYTGVEWESATNYDLCINTEQYSPSEAVQLIRGAVDLFCLQVH